MIASTLLFASIHLSYVGASLDLAYGDDSDLTNFITRPEIKAPLLEITYKANQSVSPGLWFLGPYAKVDQERFPQYYYQACSTGPHIYDNDGNLVWSGACASRNQNACDFRSFTDTSGTAYLSTIFHGYEKEFYGHATILDNTYQMGESRNVTGKALDSDFNMHEFKVVEGGRTALYLVSKPELIETRELGDPKLPIGWVSNIGFREVDLETNQIVFEWWSLNPGMVSLGESSIPVDSMIRGPFPNNWNFFHPNSVDKSSEGDYLVSGRFVDTIYKISGKDGSIIWRLGGRNSSFHMKDFTFSKQHDAQFLGYDKVTGAELISLFDNAQAHHKGWASVATSETSSCLVIALNYTIMSASLISRINRPDKGITALRGNCQHLPNGNTIGAWSENAYVSEHTPDGQLVLEAKFASQRFVTYRAYKFDFTGRPTEPPILRATVYGVTPDTSITAWYVSWNGATEVAEWRFSREQSRRNLPSTVGSAVKEGFETTFLSDGLERFVYVEAIARNGSVIGRSQTQEADWPVEWNTLVKSRKNGNAREVASHDQPLKVRQDRSEL